MNEAMIGVIGMGVMGQGIALNLAENKFNVAVYNRIAKGEEHIIPDFLSNNSSFRNIIGFTELTDFILALKRPRKVWLMVKSGKVIDILIQQLLPFLQEGDIIIDGGNSHYLDTDKRAKTLKEKNIHFAGCGVSGGQQGARHGASLMFGGSFYAYEQMSPMLKSIAAKNINAEPCEAYMGTGGAGHFIKMVHNGIEYAEMQLLAETFAVLSKQLSYEEIANLFNRWGKGRQASYLLEITADILRKKEENQYLVDLILDEASSKGTGMWSSKAALTLGEVNTIMSSAVFARYLSSIKNQRLAISKYKPQKKNTEPLDIDTLEKALYFARLVNHIQGFNLIQNASIEYNWDYNPSQISNVWMQGCIIKSQLMQQLGDYFKEKKALLEHSTVLNTLSTLETNVATLIHYAVDNKVALDTFSNSYNYWLALCTETLPANLIQAQRDFFGSHTYQRVDKPKDQFFHTNWTQDD